jgi:Undecaprenyl-phosphate glucose phosphotransferase
MAKTNRVPREAHLDFGGPEQEAMRAGKFLEAKRSRDDLSCPTGGRGASESTLWEPAVSTSEEESRDVRQGLAVLVALIETGAIAASTYLAFIAYHLMVWGALPDPISYEWMCTGLALVYGVICLADKQYDFLGAEWKRRGLERGVLALTLAFVLLLAFLFLTGTVAFYSRGTFVAQMVFALPVQTAVRIILWRAVETARKRGYWIPPGVIVLVFPGVEMPQQFLERLSSRKEEIRRIYHLEPDGADIQLKTILRDGRILQCDSALLLFDADTMKAVVRAVDSLSEIPLRLQLLPIGMLDFMHNSRIGYYGRTRVIEIVSGPSWVLDRLLKRGLDLIVGIAATLLLMPLMLIVAVWIKLDSSGPILFLQVRHGYNNKPIKVLKFRTMVEHEDNSEFCQATRDDPRVTRVGRILRRTNIDELPQLLNVIRGDMSLVGPRPHAVSHNQMYDGQIARMARRHNVKPGITGWAQVNGLRGETDTLEKMRARVEHDLYYIDHWSFPFDVKILVKTIFSRKSYENAY